MWVSVTLCWVFRLRFWVFLIRKRVFRANRDINDVGMRDGAFLYLCMLAGVFR